MGIKVWIALIGVFASFVLLVQGMGYIAFYLSPRDPDAIQRASEFEAVMGSLVRAPEDGVVPVMQEDGVRDLEAVMADVEIPNRHPEATGAVHRVMEWSGRQFGEAPMLAQRVREGILPSVSERLPEDPLVIVPPQQNGPYGGTWTRFATGPRDVGIVEARFAYEGSGAMGCDGAGGDSQSGCAVGDCRWGTQFYILFAQRGKVVRRASVYG